ncbi:LysR family transcriptional regulator [Kribbella sp. NPDC026611]|uniref:LysR family transcriptional regulator n=1 Tax=Kribbella sp. NPDC026611 TaxID=3154911 RepID=UPI0033FC25CC
MDLRQLSYFVAVAEEGQVTRAARRVLVAQPAVSAQLRSLERELGEPLFVRDPRGVRLTDAGETLLPHARAALASAERARDSVRSLRRLEHGRLRVGTSGPMEAGLISLLREFHATYPAIDLSMVERHNQPLIQELASGEFDVAMIGLRDVPPPYPLRTLAVGVEPLVVVVPRDHHLAHRKTVAVAELEGEPIVTLIRESGLRLVLEDACGKQGFSPRVVVETGELSTLVALSAAGLGIAVVPRPSVGDADVAVLRLTRPSLQRRTALAWNHENLTPAAKEFLVLARQHFAG